MAKARGFSAAFGKVKGKAKGQCIIKAKTQNGEQYEIQVTVN